MATKIVTKNSSTAGAAPTATDLVQGELAVNVADKRLFTENNGGAIVELGVNPAAEITANAGIALPDNQKATFGASDDLKIHHNGSNSFIQDSGTGDLIIAGTNLSLRNYATDEIFLDGTSNAAVRVFYNGAAKLATTSTGIDVTGTASATSVTSAQHLTAGSAYSVLFGDGGERISGNNSSSLLNFFTGATERMRIDASGNMLVGTTSSSSNTAGIKLSPAGTASFVRSGVQPLYVNRLTSDGDLAVFAKDGTAVGSIGSSTSGLYIHSPFGNDSGLVFGSERIVPCTSTGAFDDGVVDLGYSSGRFKDLYLSGVMAAGNGSVTAPSVRGTDVNTGLFFPSGGVTAIARNGVEGMRIDASGRVGIGTSSPTDNLRIHGTGNADGITIGGVGHTSRLSFARSGSPTAYIGVSEPAASGTSSLSFATGLSTNPSVKMLIDQDGNVGIGTSSPATTLHITKDGNQSAVLDAYEAQQVSHNTIAYTRWVQNALGIANIMGVDSAAGILGTSSNHALAIRTNNTERMRIDSAGTLMVGGTSLGDSESCGIEGHGSITVSRTSGTGRYMISFDNGNTNVGRITSSASATQYNTSSDQRLKENIADADDAGSKIDAIQVRKYDWKADGSHQDYGMIAQELQAVAPEAVSGDADSEEMMGVDYSKLVPMLIKEIQSLRNRVAQLEG